MNHDMKFRIGIINYKRDVALRLQIREVGASSMYCPNRIGYWKWGIRSVSKFLLVIQYKQIRVHAKQSIIVSILNRCTTIKSCNIKIPYRSRDLCRGNDLMIQQLLGIRQRGITNPVMVFILHVGQGR